MNEPTPRLSWTQPICERDWITRRGVERADGGISIPIPTQIVAAYREIEQCAFCGEATIFGVFVREDPATVPFPAVKEDR